MNKLSDIFDRSKYNTDKYDLGYIDNFYDDFFLEFKNVPIKFMEIGVNHGGSIKLWKDYLHPESVIYAADYREVPKIDNTISITRDMYKKDSVLDFSDDYFDLIIDDGPHTFESFAFLIENYFSKIKKNSYLVIEDVINKDWVDPLVNLTKSVGYSDCEIIDMTQKQKTQHLINIWKDGLYILKLKK